MSSNTEIENIPTGVAVPTDNHITFIGEGGISIRSFGSTIIISGSGGGNVTNFLGLLDQANAFVPPDSMGKIKFQGKNGIDCIKDPNAGNQMNVGLHGLGPDDHLLLSLKDDADATVAADMNGAVKFMGSGGITCTKDTTNAHQMNVKGPFPSNFIYYPYKKWQLVSSNATPGNDQWKVKMGYFPGGQGTGSTFVEIPHTIDPTTNPPRPFSYITFYRMGNFAVWSMIISCSIASIASSVLSQDLYIAKVVPSSLNTALPSLPFQNNPASFMTPDWGSSTGSWDRFQIQLITIDAQGRGTLNDPGGSSSIFFIPVTGSASYHQRGNMKWSEAKSYARSSTSNSITGLVLQSIVMGFYD